MVVSWEVVSAYGECGLLTLNQDIRGTVYNTAARIQDVGREASPLPCTVSLPDLFPDG